MNVSVAWLESLVPAGLSAEAIRDLITARCCPVDEIVRLRDDLRDVVVGLVVEASPHPNSDHLWVTKVDAGGPELLDVVCGAPNVRPGQKYPFAPAGATLPGGLKLEKRKIRGAVSNGMLCSGRELALSEDHEGILELTTDASPGTPLLQALAVGDARIVIDVTPNRPDLLSHLGVAREIAAATGVALRLPTVTATGELAAPGGTDVGRSRGAARGGAAIDAAADAARGYASTSIARPNASSSTSMSAGTITSPIADAGTRGQIGDVVVEVVDTEGAPRYCGAVIRGVTVRPSPRWLVDRLAAVGVRAINNVVDITNYLLHELGQPMHAFDLARLAGHTVIVRAARAGETIRTLDGVARRLEPGMTVIADRDRPQAVAGVMGGAESEVTDETTDVFLEVAYFDPRRTRRTRRALGLSTDASYRFERGTDLELPPAALARAVDMLAALAGGTPEGGALARAAVDLRAAPPERPVLGLRVARVAQLLGVSLSAAEIETRLASVGFEVHGRSAPMPSAVQGSVVDRSDADASGANVSTGALLRVTVPSWRPDVSREVDLVEEVARLHGYDALPSDVRPFRPGTVPDSPVLVAMRRLRDRMVGAGLLEARPLPFVAGGAEGFVRVANPIAENEAYLRRTLLDTLARRAEYNLAHTQRDVRLFEVGSVFRRREVSPGGGMPHEELHAAALVMGHRHPPHWTDAAPPDVDEWDAKELAEELARGAYPGGAIELSAPGAAVAGSGSANGGATSTALGGASGPAGAELLWEVVVDDAVVGAVHRLALDAPVWAPAAFGVELVVMPIDSAPPAAHGAHAHAGGPDSHPARTAARITYRALPVTPAAERDVALLVPAGVTAAQVEEVMRRAAGGGGRGGGGGGTLLERITLFDEYRGDQVPAGYRSLAWRLTFRHPERTLRDEEIAGRREKLLRTLEGDLGVRQRTT